MELASSHITLTSTQEMINLSVPLNILHVDFFSYTRFYFDGTSISLLTHTNWYNFFLKQEVPGSVNVFNLKTGCYLWSELFPEEAVIDAKNNFNIDNGIQFTYREKDYVEVFSFGSEPSNHKAMGYFIANIDLLEKFNKYFKKRAVNLIDKAVKSKIIIPEIMRGYQEINAGFTLGLDERRKFLNLIGYDDIIHNLSNREYECLQHISRGMTNKEVARLLRISPRTVETYINKMKDKFDCISKSQLAEIYWELQNSVST